MALGLYAYSFLIDAFTFKSRSTPPSVEPGIVAFFYSFLGLIFSLDNWNEWILCISGVVGNMTFMCSSVLIIFGPKKASKGLYIKLFLFALISLIVILMKLQTELWVYALNLNTIALFLICLSLPAETTSGSFRINRKKKSPHPPLPSEEEKK